MSRAEAKSRRNAGRDTTINIRAHAPQRDLIDRAAAALGKTRSDFMLETACREAEAVLLDRRSFMVEGEAWTLFIEALDAPASPSDELKRLLATKAPWEK